MACVTRVSFLCGSGEFSWHAFPFCLRGMCPTEAEVSVQQHVRCVVSGKLSRSRIGLVLFGFFEQKGSPFFRGYSPSPSPQPAVFRCGPVCARAHGEQELEVAVSVTSVCFPARKVLGGTVVLFSKCIGYIVARCLGLSGRLVL